MPPDKFTHIQIQSTLIYPGLTYPVPSLSAHIWLGIDLFSAFNSQLTSSLIFRKRTDILGAKVGIPLIKLVMRGRITQRTQSQLGSSLIKLSYQPVQTAN